MRRDAITSSKKQRPQKKGKQSHEDAQLLQAVQSENQAWLGGFDRSKKQKQRSDEACRRFDWSKLQEEDAQASMGPYFDLLSDDVAMKILEKIKLADKLHSVLFVCKKWRYLLRPGSPVWRTVDFTNWPGNIYPVVGPLLAMFGESTRELSIPSMDYDELADSVVCRIGHQLEKLSCMDSDLDDRWAKKFSPMLPRLTELDLCKCFELTPVGFQEFYKNCPSLTRFCQPPQGFKEYSEYEYDFD